MKKWVPWIFGVSFVVALAGALLAFALDEADRNAGPFRLDSAGLVLLGGAGLMLVWLALETYVGRPRRGGRRQNGGRAAAVQTVGGLIAVALGIGAVAALSIVTVSRLANLDDSSTVAIATSAFGVISAIVGAYLGVKVSSEQSSDAQATAEAAQAELAAATAKLAPKAKEEFRKEAGEAGAIAQKVSRSGTAST